MRHFEYDGIHKEVSGLDVDSGNNSEVRNGCLGDFGLFYGKLGGIMPKKITQFHCLLISPSDVEAERDAITKLVESWNAQIGKNLNVNIDLTKWKTHSTPDMSKSPQDVLNRQIVDDCDLGIAIFWSKVGSPTKGYISGSVEEIERLLKNDKRVLVYFCERPVPQNFLKNNQFNKLQQLRRDFAERGLFNTYTEISQLTQKVQFHITNVITSIVNQSLGIKDDSITSKSTDSNLPKPKLNVFLQLGFVSDVLTGLQDIISLTVQNTSRQVVYLRNVYLKLKDERILVPRRDAVTMAYQQKRILHSGESFSFNIDPEQIFAKINPKSLIGAGVKDDIDRTYETNPEHFAKAIKTAYLMYKKNKKKK